MRLIDADELKKWCDKHYDYEVYTIGYFTKIIDGIPTVDAVPENECPKTEQKDKEGWKQKWN